MQWFLSPGVHTLHLSHLIYRHGMDLGATFAFVTDVKHESLENIRFDQGSRTGFRAQFICVFWEFLQGVEVSIEFVVEAALEPAALAR